MAEAQTCRVGVLNNRFTYKEVAMKILIAVDMEGISGVVNWDQVDPGNSEYTRFRKTMTDDVNAAIRGLLDSGECEIVVADGHWNGSNILVEALDERVRLNSGTNSSLSMVQGIGPDVDGVFFIGYHARAGTMHAILDHTWSNKCVANVWLNGAVVGEIGLNASVCGHFGAPVILISGDQAACAEAAALVGDLETVVVKNTVSRFAADCLPPAVAQAQITAGAKRAFARLAAGKAPAPLAVKTPITVRIEFHFSEMGDVAARLPGSRRLDGRTIEFDAPDMPAAYTSFRAAVTLARAA